MSGVTMARLGAVAGQQWGLVTTAQAERVGVPRKRLSQMAASGAVERVAQGVYRLAGAPEVELDPMYATWLALGGAKLGLGEAFQVVAAGTSATVVHRVGDFLPDRYDFVVPVRRTTRLSGVRLRVRQLAPEEVTVVDGMPVLTIEAMVADLVGQWTDLSLVADTVRDAVDQHSLVAPKRLVEYLAPLAARNGYPDGDGAEFAAALFELAGVEPVGAYR